MQVPPALPPVSPYAPPAASSPEPSHAAPADRTGLRVLSTMTYLFAGLCALAWLSAALLTATGAYLESTGQASATNPVPAFVLLGAVLAVLTPLLVLLPWTAHSLRNARRRHLCLITAVLACLACPLGTALGIAMLVILQRADIRALFEARQEGLPS